jgi:hypothetical protein
MRRAAEIRKAVAAARAAARVGGVAAFVVLVVLVLLVLIIKVPGWLDPGKQRDADDCSQSGDLDRRIDACTRIIGRGAELHAARQRRRARNAIFSPLTTTVAPHTPTKAITTAPSPTTKK